MVGAWACETDPNLLAICLEDCWYLGVTAYGTTPRASSQVVEDEMAEQGLRGRSRFLSWLGIDTRSLNEDDEIPEWKSRLKTIVDRIIVDFARCRDIGGGLGFRGYERKVPSQRTV